MRPINLLVVHCSATPANQNIGAVELDRMHRERGFFRSKPVGNLNLTGIGYHYVIRRDGSIERGRDDSEVGAHAVGFNAKSLGICLVGGVEKSTDVTKLSTGEVTKFKAVDNFTLDQKHTLATLLIKLGVTYQTTNILGHRDLPAVHKDCPSFDVKAWVKATIPTFAK